MKLKGPLKLDYRLWRTRPICLSGRALCVTALKNLTRCWRADIMPRDNATQAYHAEQLSARTVCIEARSRFRDTARSLHAELTKT